MISKISLACVSVAIAVVAGCTSTSGGGSQTNWVTCKTNSDCQAGVCINGKCRNPSDTKDSGVGDARSSSSSGELGPWELTGDYPLASNNCSGQAPYLYCADQTCVAGSGYVYCVGGDSTHTYYGKLSSTGPGPWEAGGDYPGPLTGTSCVVSANYIYCVGGNAHGADGGASSPTAVVYSAPVLPALGLWTLSTPYPHVTSGAQCMADSGYIYCVSMDPDGTRSPDAYFAPISPNAVGEWTPTAAPPGVTRGCSSSGGFAYCFGGASCAPTPGGGDCYSPSYFAPLTASGIGEWKTTTELPTAVSATTASAGSYIYYLSIPVFFASVSADGIGPWQTTTNYPYSTYPANCFSSGGYLYCASPGATGSYVAQIGVSNPNALHFENPPPFPRSEYLVPAWNHTGGTGVTVNGVFSGSPHFGKNIDDAVVFDCESEAATSAGCTTTVVSSDTAYNYDLTIWYPCPNQTAMDTNCCFQPSVGYPTPFNAWCISIGSNSFIVADEIKMRQGQ